MAQTLELLPHPQLLQDQMILSEFECLEGYNTDLNWQTKSRLEMLVGPLIADRALASPRVDAAIHAEDFCC